MSISPTNSPPVMRLMTGLPFVSCETMDSLVSQVSRNAHSDSIFTGPDWFALIRSVCAPTHSALSSVEVKALSSNCCWWSGRFSLNWPSPVMSPGVSAIVTGKVLQGTFSPSKPTGASPQPTTMRQDMRSRLVNFKEKPP